MSVNNKQIKSLSASASNQNYNITIPSLNVFVDRKINWTSEVTLLVTLNRGDFKTTVDFGVDGNPAANAKIATLSEILSLNNFPLHRMVSTMSLQINDTVSTTNLDQSINEQLLLMTTDPKYDSSSAICPSYLSPYGKYSEGKGAFNNSITGFFDGDKFYHKNGAHFDVNFVDENGNVLADNFNGNVNIGGVAYPYVDGEPVARAVGNQVQAEYKFFLKFTSKEKLMISPLCYVPENYHSVGLYGVNNATLQINFKDPSRAVCYDGNRIGTEAGAITCRAEFVTLANKPGPFLQSYIDVVYLTPALDLKVSPENIVPYMEFPTYRTIDSNGFPQGINNSKTILSSTITLPSIPDSLIIAVKKTTYDATENEFYFPITNLNITFDNRSGLLNTMPVDKLYKMSYDNGLEIDFHTYIGSSRSKGRKIHTSGGFVIAKMGKDIELNPSQAPGVIGNYTLQIQATCMKPTAMGDVAIPNLQLVVMTPQSGFFKTVAGSSMIVKNLITEQDVLSAQFGGSDVENKLVGSGFFSSLASKVGKTVKNIASNPKVQDAVLKMGANVLKKKMGGKASVSGGGMKKKLSSLL
eukprot:jgi/Bigna1/144261/aug1.85_g18969